MDDDEATDDATLEADARALASVVRIRILRLCLDEALTNKEIADRLGRDPATTYHHVRTLAERGFLAAQPERRGTRGAREVPYLATRKSWRTPGGPTMGQVLIDTFVAEVAEADPAGVRTVRLGVRLDAPAVAELDRRIGELFQELADRPVDLAATPYSIFYAMHEDVGRRPR
ncbi:transcriptional regulator [Actinotalea sp. K2]|uniref:ArsR/SmtB family transcription factor n=1 Tax=Actinotalea sp. K2 TaxID=2939438 RepID=UPI002017A7F4|nr:winged helix-turn-helix domain-containing protein [Actinotalea sp. K2]MCL3859881.1 winged helix-turn-helix domain-containing protein [Actinotalea sp. K2]